MLDREQIKDILPHREPFLLLDRVTKLSPGKSAVSEKTVRTDEFFFPGHFPAEFVMPGVLIIEALAQTGAITFLSVPENKGKTVYFAGLKQVKFRRKVIPGDTLRLEAVLTRIKAKFGTGYGRAYVGDELACEAEFMFSYS
ncbi:MAG: 3-hydroxyacyl-ACP dehydratase FabZ [Chitinispirillaceae bacterium]|nr:3-hydroxyacyl-ACP dehydratase FabZ [Chitinispirillaceae bacterium]